MSLEFELPLFSLIFLILLGGIYFSKKRIKLVENKTYEFILIFSFLEVIIDTIIHFICAVHNFNIIATEYYQLFNFLNKILSLLFIMIFSCLFCYTMMITYEKIKNNPKKLVYSLIGINLVSALALSFTNIELVDVGLVTNVKGSTITIGYSIVAILIIGSLLVAIKNIKKFDKRYFPIFFVFIIISFLYIVTLAFPGLIIYDMILTLMCYIMYFTIENPDLTVINELNMAKRHAERANQAKTDFLSSMSHEIRTPLNAIVGFSDCILEEESLEKAKEDAKDIIMASQNLLEIVNGILDISKIEANKMEIVETDYEPKKIFEDLTRLVSTRIGDKPIELKTNIAIDLPYKLHGDSGKLKQIITNILTNAVKYTEKGFINFVIACVIEDNKVKLVMSVEDTGRGIKPEKMNSLFTKFERLDEDKNTTLEGTGLGLAITKKLVEMLGGKIVVQSVYGEGSKFTVYLQQDIVELHCTEKESINPIKLNSSEIYDFSNKRILVVDDNKINIKVASKLLEPYKVKVDTLESGFECIEKITQGEKYDLILMDDMMPKMTGVETFHKLKEDNNFHTPTIALTANAIVGMREKYIAEGFSDYLAKPIEKDCLQQVLNKFLLTENTKTISKNNQKEDLEILEDDSSTDIKFLKEHGIDVEKGLELLEDIETYKDTMDTFITGATLRLKQLASYKENSDMENYAILVHALKSDSKYLGFTKLAELSYEHELKSKEKDAPYIKEHFDELLQEGERIIQISKEYRENNAK